MGVSHYDRYKVTNHAKERYTERINNATNERLMLKDFNTILRNARFLSRERQGRESWFSEERNIVVIIDPKKIFSYHNLQQCRRI